MKEYKLKKLYPGCTIPVGTKVFKNGQWYQSRSATENAPHFHEPIKIVEDFPEFWEEIPEKTYEILSFTDILIPNSTGILIKHSNGRFGMTWGEYTEENQLDKLKLGKKIHSIKRLSDGEVFTVGDKIKTSVDNSFCFIYSFTLKDDNLIIDCTHSFLAKEKNINLLEDIEKIKNKLFTTEDGVDIYDGDEFYYVKFTEYNCTKGEPFEVVKSNHSSFIYEPQHEKYFSTREKAEEYIYTHKPQFSLQEIIDIVHSSTSINDIIIEAAKIAMEK